MIEGLVVDNIVNGISLVCDLATVIMVFVILKAISKPKEE